MEKEKQEIIANLYALRAGLSIISEITDKANAETENIDYIDKQVIPSINQQINNLPYLEKDDHQNYLKNISDKEQELTEKQAELSKVRNNYQNTQKSLIKSRILITIAALPVIAITVALLVLVILAKNALDIMASIPFIIGGLCATVAILGKHEKSSKKKKEIIKTDLTSISQLETEIFNLQSSISNLTDTQNTSFIIISNNYSSQKNKLSKELLYYKNKRKNSVNKLKIEEAKFKSVYTVLQEQFCSCLDERDWRNVDLIIFNYETGRAVDLRDALIQVDMERRNEKLVSALEYATKEISQSIENGFGELSNIISKKFNMLNSTIVHSTNRVSRLLNEILDQNESITVSMQKISEISSAQEALQRKINVSSEAMASDISYMKDLAHKSYYM